MKSRIEFLNDEVSDTRDDDSSTTAGYIILNFALPPSLKLRRASLTLNSKLIIHNYK